MIEIVMPRLSDSMEEGTILNWLIAEGEMVHRGDELIEVETDKAAMVHVSDADGILEILAPEGSTHPVGDVIGRLLDAAAQPAPAKPAAAQKPKAAPAPTQPTVVAEAPASAQTTSDGRIHASPVARRLAADKGVELSAVSGSGPNGRIVRADVESVSEQPKAQPMSTTEPESAPESTTTPGTAKGAVTRTEPTRSQSLIARRMSESRATVPDFTLEAEIDASRLADIRSQLRETAGTERAPTVGDIVTKACALALREHPNLNGAWRDGGFERYERINIGIAVATDAGLVVPVIFDADIKDIHELARETATLAKRARDGSITPPELSGGTFSISNLGMFGVDRFTAVINPPQSGILAVGAMRSVPVVHEGEVAPGSVISLTLAVDHRSVYGAEAAKFLRSVRERLEAPASLLG